MKKKKVEIKARPRLKMDHHMFLISYSKITMSDLTHLVKVNQQQPKERIVESQRHCKLKHSSKKHTQDFCFRESFAVQTATLIQGYLYIHTSPQTQHNENGNIVELFIVFYHVKQVAFIDRLFKILYLNRSKTQ